MFRILATTDGLIKDLGRRERLDAALKLDDENCGQDCGQTDAEASEVPQEPVISLGNVVSRVGIEPTTRRLRVCCSAN